MTGNLSNRNDSDTFSDADGRAIGPLPSEFGTFTLDAFTPPQNGKPTSIAQIHRIA
jgi:hypothetical protein